MKSVMIELERGKTPERLDFIAWKDDRLSFYARPHHEAPRVVTLTPALPGGAQVTNYRFPECAPVKVTFCRLLAPPYCEPMRERASKVRNEEVLRLAPEDDEPLRELLVVFKKDMQEEYEEKKKAAEEIEDAAKRAQRIAALETIYNGPHHTKCRMEFAGILNLTLEMVKKGGGRLEDELPDRSCVRDAYLVGKWARSNGIDLEEMDQRREDFWNWIDDRCRLTTPFPEFSDQWGRGFLALCGRVRYRIEFSDKSIAYLTACDVRRELRPAEVRELKDMHEYGQPPVDIPTKKKRGRPVETNRKNDERLLKDWESVKNQDPGVTHAIFAENKEMKLAVFKATLDRARKRRERLRIARSN